MSPRRSSTSSASPKPELSYIDADGLPDYLRQVMRGFHEEYQGDTPELDAKFFLPERTFGFKVGDQWVSTTAAQARTLTLPGGAPVDIAAVTVVTVAPTHRRRGLLREMMTHQLRATQELGEPMALLWASESVIYGRFGYGPAVWEAHLSGQTRSLAFRPEIELGPGTVAEVDADEWEAGAKAVHLANLAERPGALNRPDQVWEELRYDPERYRRGAGPLRHLLHLEPDGTPSGYASFRIKADWSDAGPNSEVRVGDLDALDRDGYLRLYRFLFDLDLVRTFNRHSAPVDDPIRHLLADPRALVTSVGDATHLRLVDVPRSLEARSYPVEVDLVLEVTDALLPENAGRWHLQAGPDGASVRKARRRPDLSLDVKELATVFLGGIPLSTLARAGLVTEHKTGAVLAGTLAFSWTRAPHTPDHF